MKNIRSKIADIIQEIEKSQSSNVVSIGWNCPKDVIAKVDKTNQDVMDCLNRALDIIEEGRKYTTNRAREELSHERHNKVYEKLEQLVETASDDPESGSKLDPKGWAETWLMFVELTDMLEESKK